MTTYKSQAIISSTSTAEVLKNKGWNIKEYHIPGYFLVTKLSTNIKEAVLEASEVARKNAVHIPEIIIFWNNHGVWFQLVKIQSFIARKRLKFYKYTSAHHCFYPCNSRLKFDWER
jgi:hypothetical protein